jgi:hypothetical protein
MHELYPSFAKTSDVFDPNNTEIRKKLEELGLNEKDIMKYIGKHKEEL